MTSKQNANGGGQARAEREGVGWHRTGSDACYFKNQLSRAKAKPFWTLTFCVETEYENDTIYLAHCFPYRCVDVNIAQCPPVVEHSVVDFLARLSVYHFGLPWR